MEDNPSGIPVSVVSLNEQDEKALNIALNKIDGEWDEYKLTELLKDLEVSRKRARVTAVTEVLTASSVAQHESYVQYPAVTGKKWKHSGGKKNQSRDSHVQLDGTIIPLDEEFEIPGSGERCMFPRDTQLTPKERVNCHCAVGPVVDPVILGLSAEEKEEIRRRVLQNME
ncbi:phage minor head protein [Bacillus sp. FSL H8-0516]|uniref:phage minor head protein n=1 Tax=Bacillus sp. FSL H8-0516 TaxID=2921397 RepID=UPI0021550A97